MQPNWINQIVGCAFLFFLFIQIFMPAVSAEMIAVQVEDIKLMLHDRLISERGILFFFPVHSVTGFSQDPRQRNIL